MSGERGRPVHLTNGERRLLVALIDAELGRLEAVEPGTLTAEATHLRALRLRQYRRLRLELRQARPGPIEGEAAGDPGEE